MVKLFDSSSSVKFEDLHNTVEQKLVDALTGKSDQFYYNIDWYLASAEQSRKNMLSYAMNALKYYSENFAWNSPAKADALIGNSTEMYLAVLGSLEHYVHVAINME